MVDLQDDDRGFRFMVTFACRSVADGEIVIETVSHSGARCEYGPMSSDMIRPFIDERKAYWRKISDEQMARFRNDLATFGSAEMHWPPTPA